MDINALQEITQKGFESAKKNNAKKPKFKNMLNYWASDTRY